MEIVMEIKFDEILEFNEELYQDNIAKHTFPEPTNEEGKGEDNE